eukprot:jgi/Hompol1/4248/HPOL_007009-RA
MTAALLFRFFKKHKFSLQNAQTALVAHIDWRLTFNLTQLCFETLSPRAVAYLQQGMFHFWKTDIKGNPVVHIAPRYFVPSADGLEMEDLRQCVIFVLDTLRRWIQTLNAVDDFERPVFSVASPSLHATRFSQFSTMDRVEVPKHYQATFVIDLQGFGMSSMNFDLVPLFFEIFQKHFPQLIGQVLVLNYGWIHAGIWGVVRSTLTTEAKERLRFISAADLPKFINVDSIPTSETV